MDIREIIRTYGTTDYYEQNTGRIFKLSEMKYDGIKDETSIPVDQDGDLIGFIKLPGDARELV